MSKRILIIAAHPDDEILGCGGIINKYICNGDIIRICYLSLGEGSRDFIDQNRKQISVNKIKKLFNLDKIYINNFKDNSFDSHSFLEIIQAIEFVKTDFDPHIVYTHSSNDLNIDHQIVNRATLTAFRPLPNTSIELILSYEVLSNTELAPEASFSPNIFEELSSCDLDKKCEAIMFYNYELRPFPHPRSVEGIKTLAAYRGMCSGLERAEAFKIERQIKRLHK